MHTTSSRVSAPAAGQLDLPGHSSRLVALLRERQRLLAKVAAKKRKVDDLLGQVEDRRAEAAKMSAALAPLFAQARAIDGEIHALFAALLSRPGLKRKDRMIISDLHQTLQEMGIISPAADSVDVDGFGPWSDDSAADDPPPPTDRESPSARRPSGAKATAIRELFRRLASAIHPDKAPDGSHEERTEAMKEVTRAYQEGDLARLLELEKAWLAGDVAGTCRDDDDSERRCANLERTNRELKSQLKTLEKRMRELRVQADPDVMSALGLAPEGQLRCADAEAMIGEQVESLRQVRDFVQSFADGKMTLDRFMAGPRIDSADEELADELADELTFELMSELLAEPPRSPGRGRSKPRSSRGGRRRK